jgi:hypothetical protein
MAIFSTHVIQTKPIRKGLMILGLVAMALAMVWARAFFGSMRAYQQGEASLLENQQVKAITFLDRSIHWYTPLNPYVQRSAEQLWRISMEAEQQGDIRLALIAARSIRRGFYSATSVYTPGKDWIRKCDVRMSKLMAMEHGNSRGVPSFSLEGAAKSPERQKQKAKHTNIFWRIIVHIGFLGWIGSALGFIMFASKDDRKATFVTSRGFEWGGAALIFFALWIIGMVKA